MRVLVAFTLLACFVLAGCSSREDSASVAPALSNAADQNATTTVPGPSVEPERCRGNRKAPQFEIPDADTVARTPWRLVLIGSCRTETGSGKSDTNFMDGWVGLPADRNGQSAKYRVDGRRSIVNPAEVGMTLALCSPQGPIGFLDTVTSWGTVADGILYLLDKDDLTVFAVEPTSAPGCIITVPPNGRKIVAEDDPACTSGSADPADQ